jgi:hypothetical protein
MATRDGPCRSVRSSRFGAAFEARAITAPRHRERPGVGRGLELCDNSHPIITIDLNRPRFRRGSWV